MTTAETSKDMWTYHSYLKDDNCTSVWYLKNTEFDYTDTIKPFDSREEAREFCKFLNS